MSAVAALVTTPGADPVATAAATVPGDAAVSDPGWSSSQDAPVVTLENAWSSAGDDAGAAGGSTILRGVSVFGGEISLRGLRLSAAEQGAEAPTVGELVVRHLAIDGQPVDAPEPGADPIALGDWGTLRVGVPTGDDARPGVAALLIDITASHDGLVAGSEVVLGLVTFTPPADNTGAGGSQSGGGVAAQPVGRRQRRRADPAQGRRLGIVVTVRWLAAPPPAGR